MRIAAMVIGILSGLGLLGYAAIGGAFGDLVTWSGQGGGTTIKLLSFGIPIAALVGAGLVLGKPLIGGGLMLGSAIVMFLWLGVGNFTLVLGIPLLIAGGMGVLGNRELTPAPAGPRGGSAG